MKWAILGVALLAPAAAYADAWLNVGGVSTHFGATQDNGQPFNAINSGLGIEADIKGVTVSAGVYRNSIDRQSRYMAAEKMLLERGRFGFGVSAGVVDGYYYRDGGPMPMILPVARWDGDTIGLRALFIPPVDSRVTAAVAIQVRLRIR